jgi:hypothetical protein
MGINGYQWVSMGTHVKLNISILESFLAAKLKFSGGMGTPKAEWEAEW